MKHQKLELTWISKENVPRLEPRILLEDASLSYHAPRRVTDDDLFDNRLIFGDNLLALKALELEFFGAVQCIYIDPPYNTGAVLENYDDGLEHSTWLSFMRDRLLLLERLLAPDGVIFVHIDDSEGPYLKVLLDEVFGRDRHLITFYVQVRYPEKTLKQDMVFNKVIEQVHCYGGRSSARVNLEEEEYDLAKFCWYVEELGSPTELALGGKKVELFEPSAYHMAKKEPSLSGLKEIWATGAILDGNSSGRFFRDYIQGRQTEDGLGALYKVYGIGDDQFPYRYFTGPKKATATKGKYFQGVPNAQVDGTSKSKTKSLSNFLDLAGAFGNCRHEGGVEFRSGKKPEALLRKLIELATRPGDLVLDSFAGSGTTGAVAHKLGRRWIMIESVDESCNSRVLPRVRSVVDGTDQTGASLEVGWAGGGGFRYFRVAPSLLERDKYGNWIISKQYNAAMLSEALCKHEGFIYSPSETAYWQHGHSTERDFIYVTTQSLNPQQIAELSEDVGENRSLLVCCTSFRGKSDRFPNLTLKKIPKAVLNRCEWGKDDYSLAIASLPIKEPEAEAEVTARPPKARHGVAEGQGSLFTGGQGA